MKQAYQGVTAYVGMPGSGKTYSLAWQGLRAMARGRRVISNAGFDLVGSEVMGTFDEFASLRVLCEDRDHVRDEWPREPVCPAGKRWVPITIVWDELPLYFNARKWAEFPDAMMYRFTQVRKDGLELYYSAIHEGMIDVNIRRVTFWFWHCRAVTGRILMRRLFPPEEFRRQGARPYAVKWYRVSDGIASAYDTTRKVALPRKLRERISAGVPELGTWDAGERREGSPAGATPAPVDGSAPVPVVPLR
jgi:hypothetical protein